MPFMDRRSGQQDSQHASCTFFSSLPNLGGVPAGGRPAQCVETETGRGGSQPSHLVDAL